MSGSDCPGDEGEDDLEEGEYWIVPPDRLRRNTYCDITRKNSFIPPGISIKKQYSEDMPSIKKYSDDMSYKNPSIKTYSDDMSYKIPSIKKYSDDMSYKNQYSVDMPSMNQYSDFTSYKTQYSDDMSSKKQYSDSGYRNNSLAPDVMHRDNSVDCVDSSNKLKPLLYLSKSLSMDDRNVDNSGKNKTRKTSFVEGLLRSTSRNVRYTESLQQNMIGNSDVVIDVQSSFDDKLHLNPEPINYVNRSVINTKNDSGKPNIGIEDNTVNFSETKSKIRGRRGSNKKITVRNVKSYFLGVETDNDTDEVIRAPHISCTCNEEVCICDLDYPLADMSDADVPDGSHMNQIENHEPGSKDFHTTNNARINKSEIRKTRKGSINSLVENSTKVYSIPTKINIKTGSPQNTTKENKYVSRNGENVKASDVPTNSIDLSIARSLDNNENKKSNHKLNLTFEYPKEEKCNANESLRSNVSQSESNSANKDNFKSVAKLNSCSEDAAIVNEINKFKCSKLDEHSKHVNSVTESEIFKSNSVSQTKFLNTFNSISCRTNQNDKELFRVDDAAKDLVGTSIDLKGVKSEHKLLLRKSSLKTVKNSQPSLKFQFEPDLNNEVENDEERNLRCKSALDSLETEQQNTSANYKSEKCRSMSRMNSKSFYVTEALNVDCFNGTPKKKQVSELAKCFLNETTSVRKPCKEFLDSESFEKAKFEHHVSLIGVLESKEYSDICNVDNSSNSIKNNIFKGKLKNVDSCFGSISKPFLLSSSKSDLLIESSTPKCGYKSQNSRNMKFIDIENFSNLDIRLSSSSSVTESSCSEFETTRNLNPPSSSKTDKLRRYTARTPTFGMNSTYSESPNKSVRSNSTNCSSSVSGTSNSRSSDNHHDNTRSCSTSRSSASSNSQTQSSTASTSHSSGNETHDSNSRSSNSSSSRTHDSTSKSSGSTCSQTDESSSKSSNNSSSQTHDSTSRSSHSSNSQSNDSGSSVSSSSNVDMKYSFNHSVDSQNSVRETSIKPKKKIYKINEIYSDTDDSNNISPNILNKLDDSVTSRCSNNYDYDSNDDYYDQSSKKKSKEKKNSKTLKFDRKNNISTSDKSKSDVYVDDYNYGEDYDEDYDDVFTNVKPKSKLDGSFSRRKSWVSGEKGEGNMFSSPKKKSVFINDDFSNDDDMEGSYNYDGNEKYSSGKKNIKSNKSSLKKSKAIIFKSHEDSDFENSQEYNDFDDYESESYGSKSKNLLQSPRNSKVFEKSGKSCSFQVSFGNSKNKKSDAKKSIFDEHSDDDEDEYDGTSYSTSKGFANLNSPTMKKRNNNVNSNFDFNGFDDDPEEKSCGESFDDLIDEILNSKSSNKSTRTERRRRSRIVSTHDDYDDDSNLFGGYDKDDQDNYSPGGIFSKTNFRPNNFDEDDDYERPDEEYGAIGGKTRNSISNGSSFLKKKNNVEEDNDDSYSVGNMVKVGKKGVSFKAMNCELNVGKSVEFSLFGKKVSTLV